MAERRILSYTNIWLVSVFFSYSFTHHKRDGNTWSSSYSFSTEFVDFFWSVWLIVSASRMGSCQKQYYSNSWSSPVVQDSLPLCRPIRCMLGAWSIRYQIQSIQALIQKHQNSSSNDQHKNDERACKYWDVQRHFYGFVFRTAI